MRLFGSVLIIISIVIVFFNYNIAVLILGCSLLLFGGHQLKENNKQMAYIQFIFGLIFIIGILISGF